MDTVKGHLVIPADTNRVNFFPVACVNWTNGEMLELDRLRAAYQSPQYEIECNSTEDGDPWCVVSDSTLDRVIVHIARIGRTYVVIHPEKNVSRKVAQIETAIDLVLQ